MGIITVVLAVPHTGEQLDDVFTRAGRDLNPDPTRLMVTHYLHLGLA